MKLKTDWTAYLHRVRTSEIERICSRFPEKSFNLILELGAGDGFQSGLLASFADRVISTDYHPPPQGGNIPSGVSRLVCDAETSAQLFNGANFDLIFSSNLLEHVPEPVTVLNGCAALLKEGGIAVHIMPGVFWKWCHCLLYLPAWTAVRLETLSVKGGYKILIWELKKFIRDFRRPRQGAEAEEGPNNPKTGRIERGHFWKFFIPEPHGVSPTNIKELLAFSKSRWKRVFARSDLELISITRGPVTSGYGFGLDRLRKLLEGLGLCSEYIYIAVRRGERDKYPVFLRQEF